VDPADWLVEVTGDNAGQCSRFSKLMKRKFLIQFYVSLLLCNTIHIWAAPLRLTVQPKGTNEVELTLSPVVPNGNYEIMARTNGSHGHWIKFAELHGASNTTITTVHDFGHVEGLTLDTLRNWKFVAGRWDDPMGDELPPLYKELVLRIDPFARGEPYGDPMGDGWVNLQKLQNDMDPLTVYAPPAPRLNVGFRVAGTNFDGQAVLTWEPTTGPVPDYFVVERATRTRRPSTNNLPFMRPGPYGLYRNYPTNRPTNGAFFRRTNQPPNWPTNVPFRGLTNRFAGSPTNRWQNFPGNRPPNSLPGYGRPGFNPEANLESGPFVAVARVPGHAGSAGYQYVDTNVDVLIRPLYRVTAHNVPPPRAYLNQVDEAGIRRTMISVTAQPSSNGYTLSVPHPIPYARYLLLVRDKNNSQWRASGYFESDSNRAPVSLHVDKKGMMSDGQTPIALPHVRFLPDVVEPEFTAGWGEDSDGDGLPDIYEVLVTHTKPDNADTGNTGILDGYKEMAGDGLNNLEKFRRRADPLKTAHPPATVELIRPTAFEIADALTPKTDLYCDIHLEVRSENHVHFEALENVPSMLSEILNFRQPEMRRNFDLRVAWNLAPPERRAGSLYPDEPPWLPLLGPLMERINADMTEAFKRHLETNPPLSWNEATNLAFTIMHDYREGKMDKGQIMIETAAIEDNTGQDFYGKVIDQHGDPVVGAKVTAEVKRGSGPGGSATTQTDSGGLFQFTGLRGKALNITPEKEGFQIKGHGLGLKNLKGPETTSIRPAIYTMWKLRNPEPMLHGKIGSYTIRHGILYAVDLVKNTITEGTNGPGDFWIQVDGPVVFKRGDFDDWSLTMTAVDGGFIEVTDNRYFDQAPPTGYQPKVQMANRPSDPSLPRLNTDRTFYLKSRGGQIYSHFRITELMPHNFGKFAQFYIDYCANPAGSRNLQFDPAKQIK
jgi:hypothetical protein